MAKEKYPYLLCHTGYSFLIRLKRENTSLHAKIQLQRFFEMTLLVVQFRFAVVIGNSD
jgi:RecB family endonuclease NucS